MRGENIDSRMEENNSSASTGFIKAAFNGLGVRKSISKPGSRSALGAFGKIMNEKISKQAEVDKQRLDFDKEKHESAKLTDDKRFEIELLKVNYFVNFYSTAQFVAKSFITGRNSKGNGYAAFTT